MGHRTMFVVQYRMIVTGTRMKHRLLRRLPRRREQLPESIFARQTPLRRSSRIGILLVDRNSRRSPQSTPRLDTACNRRDDLGWTVARRASRVPLWWTRRSPECKTSASIREHFRDGIRTTIEAFRADRPTVDCNLDFQSFRVECTASLESEREGQQSCFFYEPCVRRE